MRRVGRRLAFATTIPLAIAATFIATTAPPALAAGFPLWGTAEGQPTLNVRYCPEANANCPVINKIPFGTAVYITSAVQDQNGWVNGLWGWTDCWDYLPAYGGYASDGYIYTGSNTCG